MNFQKKSDDIWTIFPLKKEGRLVKFSRAIKAVVYFKDSKLDLLTGKKTTFSATKIIDKLGNYDLKRIYRRPVVFHLFYEFGYLLKTF